MANADIGFFRSDFNNVVMVCFSSFVLSLEYFDSTCMVLWHICVGMLLRVGLLIMICERREPLMVFT